VPSALCDELVAHWLDRSRREPPTLLASVVPWLHLGLSPRPDGYSRNAAEQAVPIGERGRRWTSLV
jgi:hypothetical protein